VHERQHNCWSLDPVAHCLLEGSCKVSLSNKWTVYGQWKLLCCWIGAVDWLASRVQLTVASVIAVIWTWVELSCLPEPADKYKERRGNGYACRDKYAKVRTSLNSECYRPSDMLIHRQNSYAPRGKWHTGRREAQNRGTGQQSKSPPCRLTIQFIKMFQTSREAQRMISAYEEKSLQRGNEFLCFCCNI
jgi:hypothetical protein